MIPARKSEPFSTMFAWDVARRLQASFASIRVRGLDDLRTLASEHPILVVSNHTAWWDPLVIFHLVRGLLRLDGYALMDQKNLRAFPFFALLGGFGVDLDDAADGAKAIRYAAKLLDRPGRLVWFFPQGRERPITARPLDFKEGAAAVGRVAKAARVVPAAMRYEFGRSPSPTLLVSFGPSASAERDVTAGARAQEEAVLRELARIDKALADERFDDFELLHERPTGAAFALAQRALAWLARGPAIGPERGSPGG